MIIDDHVHVHEWSFQKGEREFEADYVIALTDEWGIDKSSQILLCSTSGAPPNPNPGGTP
ncbi:MAG: hypothetical protein EXR27_01185 [Betaproteobacteria bacterium]|nr:hypothetical protein [Betaproteobacteria bacterium]